MPATHLPFDTGTQFGSAANAALRDMERSLDRLREQHATWGLMIDGPNDQDASYAILQVKMGTPTAAVARAIYEEVSACLFKLTTNTQVDNVNAAVMQMFNKLRQGG